MRFLHIADLHLGKQMNDLLLLDDQEAVLDAVPKSVADPDGGAADRPGRTQAAADYGERESKKRKKESQIKEITLFSVGKADAIGAEGWVRPTSCAKLYLWFENGRMVLPIRVKVSDQQNVR